jgi:ubiquinone/menaquinone biosynthesis C-methylase UbiE
MPDATTTTVTVSMKSALAPQAAFQVMMEELALALDRVGMRFEPGTDGRLTEGEFEVGRVAEWTPGQQARLRWRPADWQPELETEVALRVEPDGEGARITLEQRGWGALIDDSAELVGWFAGEAAAPLLRATTPVAFGDWLIDRMGRRPTGAMARAIYSDPLYHWPNFRVILAELDLTPQSYLLEVGCGGGALLREELKSGCRAAAIDHSLDMVKLASEQNHDAIAEGRLSVQQASAERLPFADATFTHAVMTGVLGHLPDAVAALREIRRTLVVGGRFIALGSDPELRGTPAAPEPAASRISFYDAEQFGALAAAAGFTEFSVERRDLEQYAREAGVPEEHLALFQGPGALFLFARKS